jgi:hypothetical protein
MKTQVNPPKLNLQKTVIVELLQNEDLLLKNKNINQNEVQPTDTVLTNKSCIACITIEGVGACQTSYCTTTQ